MTKTLRPEALNWMVPVPVAPATYQPLFPRHADLNVEVTPVSIFGAERTPISDEKLLWSDLQAGVGPVRSISGKISQGNRSDHFGGKLEQPRSLSQ
jgi:hypothetical protein